MNINLDGKLKEHIEDAHREGIKEHLLPHVDLIFRCACRLAKKQHDAEDLTQETFYYAIKNFSQLKDIEKSKNWLFAILKNLFLKEIEKGKKWKGVEFDIVSNQLSGATNVEKDFVAHESKKKLREVLAKLDERLRRPIEMFYFERMPYKEIANSLGLPIGTVMSRIARGKVFLKKELKKTGEF